jgi:hypothetical protein
MFTNANCVRNLVILVGANQFKIGVNVMIPTLHPSLRTFLRPLLPIPPEILCYGRISKPLKDGKSILVSVGITGVIACN